MSEWTCPKCRTPMAASSRFCPNCGQPIASVPSATQPKNVWPWVIAFVGLLALAVGGLIGSGVLRFGAQPGPAQLQVKAEPAPVQLEARAEKPPEIKMPDDVYQWLKHLEETEKRRGKLALTQTGRARALMAKLSVAGAKMQLDAILGEVSGSGPEVERPPEQTEFVDEVGPMKLGWAELTAFFNSVPVPAECQPIASNYQKTLDNTSGAIIGLVEIVQNPPTDPSEITNVVAKLEGTRGDSEENIGQPAADADAGVGDLCDRYVTRKWFSIHRDFGGSAGLFSAGAGGY